MTEEECRKVLSLNVKRYRKIVRLSQTDVSKMMGISCNFLSDIETCKGWVSPLTLVKLAEALGIEVYQLFKPPDPRYETRTDVLTEVMSQSFDTVLGSVRFAVEQATKRLVDQYIIEHDEILPIAVEKGHRDKE